MLNPESDVPSHIRRELTRYGGKNPYGGAIWRVVRAEHRFRNRGGSMNDYGGPMDNVFHFDAQGRYCVMPVKPVSTAVGVRPQRVYPVHGFILERWFPAKSWGTKEWWDSQKADDGTNLCGEYPAEGEYWLLSGPWEKLPSLEFLRNKIRTYEYGMDLNAEGSFEQKLKDITAYYDAQEGKIWDEWEAQRQYAIQNIVKPMMNSLSLAAQRERQRVMNMNGVFSHVAAGGGS